LIVLKEISNSSVESPANVRLGHVVPSQSNPLHDSSQSQLNRAWPEEEQVYRVAVVAQSFDERKIRSAGEGCLKCEGNSLCRESPQFLQHQAPGPECSGLWLQRRQPSGNQVCVYEPPAIDELRQKATGKRRLPRPIRPGNDVDIRFRHHQQSIRHRSRSNCIHWTPCQARKRNPSPAT
jgi:hypothetical protein